MLFPQPINFDLIEPPKRVLFSEYFYPYGKTNFDLLPFENAFDDMSNDVMVMNIELGESLLFKTYFLLNLFFFLKKKNE